MYLGKQHILAINFIVLLHVTASAGSLANEVRDVGITESASLTQTTKTHMVRPVDQHLLQRNHLNTWKDLRMLDEVVRHNKVSSVFLVRVEKLSKEILSNSDSHNWNIQEDARIWATGKKNKPYAIVLYYLIEVLKSHSPQKSHKEIERLAQGMKESFKSSYFYKLSFARQMVDSFMDEAMSMFGSYLLMRQFTKDLDVVSAVGPHSSVKQGKYEWKKAILQGDLDGFTGHYLRYMKLIEILDILAAAGIQDSDVIKKVDPKRMKLSSARKILSQDASQARPIHKYLVNSTPYEQYGPLKFHVFGYPPDINGKSSAEIEATFLELWKRSVHNDIEIASQLCEISNSDPNADTTFPTQVRRTRGYRALKKKYKQDDSQQYQMWNHMSRNISLVVSLDKHGSAERLILWQILRSVLVVISKDAEPKKCERYIENSLMFYLFIRRIGEVLEEVVDIHFPKTPSERKTTRAQFMMYYWSLLTLKSAGDSRRLERTIKCMEFKVGRVYLDHLMSSQSLDSLDQQMKLYQKTRPKQSAAKEVRTFGSRLTKDFKTDHNASRSGCNYSDPSLESPPHALKNSPASENLRSGSNQYMDRLNFQVPRRKPTRYPTVMVSDKAVLAEKAITYVAVQQFPRKRKSVMEDFGGSNRDILTGFPKAPRCKIIGTVSPEGSGCHWPIQDADHTAPIVGATQSTPHNKNSQGDRGDIDHLNPEPPLLIQEVFGKTLTPSKDTFSSFDLNAPCEDASGDNHFDTMLPDLNQPLKPVSTQDKIQKDTPGIPIFSDQTFWQHRSDGASVSAQHDSLPQVTSWK